jgi:exonuclease VII small subunit
MAIENDIDYEKLAKAIREGMGPGINLDPENLQTFFKSIKTNTSTIGGLTKEMITGIKKYKDFSGAVTSLDVQIGKLEDSFDDLDDNAKALAHKQKEELTQKREAIQKMSEHNAKQRAVVEGLTDFSKALISTAAKTAGNFAKGLQDGASSFSLAGGLMEGAIDGAKAGADTLGTGLNSVGNTMAMSTNPKVKAMGMAASVAGSAVKGLGDAAAAAAKFWVQYMVKEAEQTVEAFNKTSASGALFADGMTGMRNAAAGAGLTVKQFGEVMSKNSDKLGQSGVGVAEGAKQMGRVGSIMKQTGITDSLLKLGYGFEEQAELTAETIANMRRSAGGTVSDREVATQTAKYADSLRLIAAITGEDAKKKAEAVRNENQILAFQIEMAKKTPAQRAQIDAAMATMTEQERKNFRDRAILGEVVNKEGAIYESTMDGARQKGEAALALFNNNNLTAESNAKLNAQYSDQLKQSGLAQKDFAIAAQYGGGQLSGVAKAQLDVVNQSNQYTKEGVKNAEKSVIDQKSANDELTAGVVTAAKAAQNLAINLQELVLPQLSKFADITAQVLESMNKYAKDFKDVTAAQDAANLKVMTFWEKLDSGMARVVEWLGEFVDSLSMGAVSGILNFLTGKTIKDIKQERIEKETAYLAKTGRATGPAAAAPAGTPGSSQAGPPAPPTMAGAPPASGAITNGRGGDDPNRYTGLNIGGRYPGEAIAGGPANDRLISLARKVQEMFPGGRFNAFNDTAHSNGDHPKGNAFDFSLPFNIKGDDERGKRIVAQIKELGLPNVLDEYNHPSAGATGGHIHAALAGGGIASATPGGTNVKVGEGGRDELITPLINGRLPGMDELIEAVNRLVRVSEAQHSTSEKILYATA